MNISFKEEKRHVIPRWRDFQTTLKLNELNSYNTTVEKIDYDISPLLKKQYEWQKNKSLVYATDLVASALVFGKYNYAKDAAEYILNNDELVSELSIKQAKIILGEKNICSICNYKSQEDILNNNHLGGKINALKRSLYNDQYNSIVWADLSREYAIIGKINKALKCMKVALNLTPENRYILRSANRLYIHAGDISQAHYILSKSPLINHDPWILASELSTSSILGHTSKFIKTGRKIIESNNYHSSQISELSSELATIEFYSGNNKSAKKLFMLSLNNPNDNSVAQAIWISMWLPTIDIVDSLFEIPCTYEAKAIKSLFEGNWKQALVETLNWLDDLPFSSKPAILGTYISSTLLEDYILSEKIAHFGLKTNPTDNMLLNNLTFALINQNKIDEAEKIFSQIKISKNDNNDNIVYNATNGLIHFYKGKEEEARNLYQTAINLATISNSKERRASASIYLAKEEITRNTPYAKNAFDMATKYIKDINDPTIIYIFERLADLYKKNTNLFI